MKRLFTIVAVTLLVTSCAKDWTCECYDYDGELYETYVIKGKSKKAAKSQCTGSVSIGLVTVPGDNNCMLSK